MAADLLHSFAPRIARCPMASRHHVTHRTDDADDDQLVRGHGY